MRVWITGVGIISALGASARETFDALNAGQRGLSEIDLFDTTGQRARLGAQVRRLKVPAGAVWSRSSALALSAASEALVEAGLDPKRARVGLVVGGTTAGMFEDELRVSRMLAQREPRRPLPEMVSHPLSATLDALHGEIGPFYRHSAVASACSSGASALWIAQSWLATDDSLDAVLAGGSEGLCRLTFTGFNALTAMDPDPCRPFDRGRRGMNLGEGAGFMVLERARDAGLRKARPIAEIGSISLCSEAHHITNPEASGTSAGAMIARGLARAGIDPSMVDYVNAHGTATALNDAMEARALALALGEHLSSVPVSSSKAQLGHTLGAAGAIEAVISALALSTGRLPPNAGLTEVDPECAGLHLLRQSRAVARVRAVLSNSFGFGGMDAAVVLTEPELSRPVAMDKVRVVVTGAAALGPRGLITSMQGATLCAGAQAAGPVVDVASELDAARARRLDRSARLVTTVAQSALRDAAITEGRAVGIVMGSAFSAVDQCAAFMLRVVDKGPRFANPLDFPNLVPSSPVGHASIYLQLRGPAMAVADLQASGENALLACAEAIASGGSDAMVACGCDEGGVLVDEVFGPLFDWDPSGAAPRSEGAAAVVLESEPVARQRNAEIIAIIEFFAPARSGPLLVPPPRDPRRAAVVSPRGDLLWDSPIWESVRRVDVATGSGRHEGQGASAAVLALGLLRAGDVDEVLLVGARPFTDGSMIRYAFAFRRP